VVAAPAQAVELPTRKAGLWEIKMAMAAPMPGMTMQQCTDETTDRLMSTMFGGPAQKDTCTRKDVSKTATGYAVDSTCTFGTVAMTSHVDISGDFQSAYTVQMTTHRDAAAGAAPHDTTMTMEAKWLGACKSDQKPGDIIMPGGIKMNVKDIESLRGQGKKP
jgi:hypothetical protein